MKNRGLGMAQLAECLLVWHSTLEALSVAPTGTCAWWSTPVGPEGQSHHPYSVGIHDWSGLDCVKRSMAPGRRGFIALYHLPRPGFNLRGKGGKERKKDGGQKYRNYIGKLRYYTPGLRGHRFQKGSPESSPLVSPLKRSMIFAHLMELLQEQNASIDLHLSEIQSVELFTNASMAASSFQNALKQISGCGIQKVIG